MIIEIAHGFTITIAICVCCILPKRGSHRSEKVCLGHLVIYHILGSGNIFSSFNMTLSASSVTSPCQ